MAHYKLRDPGTSYHNVMQQATIVGNRIVELQPDEHVNRAVRERRIVKVEDENEIKEALQKQKEYDDSLASRTAALQAAPTDAAKAKVAQEQAANPLPDKPAGDAVKPVDRPALEAAYKEATGNDASVDASDEELQKAVDEANADKGNKATGLSGLDA